MISHGKDIKIFTGNSNPALAAEICKYIKPDAIFHHDDWGSHISTFMDPVTFRDFYKPAYEKIYGYYKSHGVELVVHHSDGYAATLVPAMIEMGIDVWQGCFSTNDIPDLISKYGDKITFMGGIENHLVDFEGWTEENNRYYIEKTIKECGNKYFIPCIAQGGPGSVFPGVYMNMCDLIDQHNIDNYGATKEELEAAYVYIEGFQSYTLPVVFVPGTDVKVVDFDHLITDNEMVISIITEQSRRCVDMFNMLGWDTESTTYHVMATDKFFVPATPVDYDDGEIRGALSGSVNGTFPEMVPAQGKINDVIYLEKVVN